MRFARELIFVALVMLIIGLAGKAFGAECHLGPAAVRAANPGSWPSWSHHIGGHIGSKCWYATWPTHGKTQVVEKSSTLNPEKSSPVSSSSTPTSDAWAVVPLDSAATNRRSSTRGSKHERQVVHAILRREGKHATPSYTATPMPSASMGVPLPRARALSPAEVAKLFRDYQEWVTFGSSGPRPVWEQHQNAAP